MYRSMIVLTVSIAVLPTAVKAQEGNSPSFNKDNKEAGSSRESRYKDSVKDVQIDFSKLIQTVLISGTDDGGFPDGFAQAVGLSQPMPSQYVHANISRHGDKEDSRECNVAYGPDKNNGRRAVCVLFNRSKRTKGEMHDKYYRVNLDGQLEGAVTLNAKLGPDGKAIPEGHSRSDDDITSPEIQKAFRVEMAYWLKDWLKKHPAKPEAAKLTEPLVREHATAEHQAVDREAAAVPAASASASSAQ